MRIKRLDIAGFKSFPDKTTLVFDRPIVGVVGPNGCGKSNIVDAIRWVMGEQSVKALRGAAREDVIFAGTQTRAAMGLAQVTLTFDNADKLAPPQYADYPEIAITRKLYRNGESVYLLNNSDCRLKDITDLFLGTGVGNRAYSIIEQGQVARIVSSKPEDRRFLIEEAAGITKYYSRKREAERKIEYTRQNLLRISDILGELKKQLDSLSRQAKKAERYKELKTRMKDLDLRFTAREYQALLSETEATNKRIDELYEAVQERENGLMAAENTTEARVLEHAAREQVYNDRQAALYRSDQAIKLDERNVEVFSEELARLLTRATEAQSEKDGLARDLSEAGERLTAIEDERGNAVGVAEARERALNEAQETYRDALNAFNRQQATVEAEKKAIYAAMGEADRAEHKLETLALRISELAGRREQNRKERAESDTRLNGLNSERSHFVEALGGLREFKTKLDEQGTTQGKSLEEARKAYFDSEDILTEERQRLTAQRSRLDSLRELDRSLEGFAEAVKALLNKHVSPFGEGELIDVLARQVQVDGLYEKALGAFLGERLQWLVVRDPEAAQKGVERLLSKNAGRAGLAAQSLAALLPAPTLKPLPSGERPLAEFLKVGEAVRPLILSLVADVYVAPDLDAALVAWKRSPGSWAFVTPQGVVLEKSGAINGGSGESLSQNLLRRRRELEELEKAVGVQQKVVEELGAKRDAQLAAIRELESALETTRQEGHRQEIRILEQEKDLHRLESDLDQAKRRADALDREFAIYETELARLKNERHELSVALNECLTKREQSEEALREAQAALERLAEKRETSSRQVADERVAAAQAAERRAHLDDSLRGARQRQNELRSRLERLDFELSRGAERAGHLRVQIDLTQRGLGERIEERQRLQLGLAEERDALNREQNDIAAALEAQKKGRVEVDRLKASLNEAQVARSESLLKTGHVEERIHERYGLTFSTEYPEYLDGEDPGDDEREEMEALRGRIDKFGDVHLGAIAEYDSVSERFQFLSEQEDDLKKSLERLEEAISKINRTTRKRFRETFEMINTRFAELFPQMFGGGEARLEYTDPNDLLKTGIEIVVQPPGKALQSISLRSGGEKALTAMALIFAIFLFRPTPFCLLDEVDAPLDDVNIGRFNTTVRRISKVSQFIIITHNKKTMEITDTLYGVTMEEPGISKIVSVNLR